MAEQEAAAVEEVAPKKGGKLKIIVLALVGVLLLVVGVVVYLVMSSPPPDAEGGEAAEVVERKPPVYETLAVFTVNLSDREHFLQTELQLALENVEAQKLVKDRMPEVRDVLIRLLSSKTVDELTQADGKDRLADEIRQQVNGVLGVQSDAEGVRKVLFAAFIIQ